MHARTHARAGGRGQSGALHGILLVKIVYTTRSLLHFDTRQTDRQTGYYRTCTPFVAITRPQCRCHQMLS